MNITLSLIDPQAAVPAAVIAAFQAIYQTLETEPADTQALRAWAGIIGDWLGRYRPEPARPRVPLGPVFVMDEAARALSFAEVSAALLRHARGDWGGVSEAEWNENAASLVRGLRLFSIYTTGSGRKLWIRTEADRSSTTVMLAPE